MDFIERTDPELVDVLDTLEPGDFSDLPAPRAARLRAIRAASGDRPPAAGVERSDVDAPGLEGQPDVPLRVYRPARAPSRLPCLYWIHGVDAARIVVAGRSSGGGAAAGLALLARDRGGPAVHHQLLIYPMLDDRAISTTRWPGRSGPGKGRPAR